MLNSSSGGVLCVMNGGSGFGIGNNSHGVGN